MINDEMTGEVVVYQTASVPADMETKQFLLQTSYSPLTAGTTLKLSDAKVYRIDSNTTKAKVVATSLTGEAISVDDEISLEFNIPVFGRIVRNNAQKLNTIAIDNTASIKDIKVHNFNKAIVSFNNLNFLSEHELDYSGMDFIGATLDSSDAGAVQFETTGDPDNELTLKGAVTLDGVDAGNEISISLYSQTGVKPVLIAAFYTEEGAFEGAEVFNTDTDIPAKEIRDFTLTLKRTHTDAVSFKIFAWDGVGTLKPLMRAKNGAFL